MVSVPSPASSMPFSSASPFRSTSTSGDAARAFITLISVWPPASARAPSCRASSEIAAATDAGFAYSTSRSSTGAILRILLFARDRFRMDPVRRVLQRAACPAGPHGEQLRQDRQRGLGRRLGADVEAGGPRDALELRVRDAGIVQQLAPALLVATRAERADVGRVARELRQLRRAVAHGRPVLPHEQLGADPLAGDDGEHDGAVAGLDDPAQLVEQIHSSGSTKMSISPPHGSPTSRAMSSVIPYVSSRGGPPASTSCAASTTSLSTQPPETEPASSPRSLTASFEPTGLGEVRRVATTVAIATFSPCPRQRSISGSSSFTVPNLAAMMQPW